MGGGGRAARLPDQKVWGVAREAITKETGGGRLMEGGKHANAVGGACCAAMVGTVCAVHCALHGRLAGCVQGSGFGDPYSLPPAAIYTQLGLREDLGIP